MSKEKKFHDPKRVTVLAILKHKEGDIMIQGVDNVYQFIIYYKGNFFSSYNCVTSEKQLTGRQLTEVTNLVADQAKTTVEMLIARDNGEDILKKNEQGAAIIEELDKAFASQKPHRT